MASRMLIWDVILGQFSISNFRALRRPWDQNWSSLQTMFNLSSISSTVWPEPILKKVSGWWQIPPQHQSTYLGGPESASIEIPPFRPFLWCKFPKIKIFKNFRIAPKFFCSLKKKLLVWKKLLLKFYEVRSERGDFNWCWFWAS